MRAVVMGLGQFGGGLGAALHLVDRGYEVLVTDKGDATKFDLALAALDPFIKSGQVRTRMGGHDIADFQTADLVVANPAISTPWKNELLLAANNRNARVVSEVNLLVEALPTQRCIGITGSAGKSTTSALTHALLCASGRQSHLGGNIGGSLLQSIPSMSASDWVVLELSSFMLWWLGPGARLFGGAPWAPAVGALTNLAANHLDWHGSYAEYSLSKATIRGAQTKFVSHFAEESPKLSRAAAAAATVSASGNDESGFMWWQCNDAPLVPPLNEIKMSVPGAHQRHNARLAWALAKTAAQIDGRPFDDSCAAPIIEAFAGLAHRLQFVGEFGGLRCFNDSKATTPEAALLAVECFDNRKSVHLIVGGADKGADLTPIRNLAPHIGGLYAIGITGKAIAGDSTAILCGTIEVAVATAASRAQRGDILLLSPACASWDQFVNFEQRGDRFVELVRALVPHG